MWSQWNKKLCGTLSCLLASHSGIDKGHPLLENIRSYFRKSMGLFFCPVSHTRDSAIFCLILLASLFHKVSLTRSRRILLNLETIIFLFIVPNTRENACDIRLDYVEVSVSCDPHMLLNISIVRESTVVTIVLMKSIAYKFRAFCRVIYIFSKIRDSPIPRQIPMFCEWHPKPCVHIWVLPLVLWYVNCKVSIR